MIQIARPVITDEEIEEMKKVLKSGYLVSGEKVKEFEEKFASYCGVEHAVVACNGTAALNIALETCGLKTGDEVITTPFSFISSSNCILFAGAKPVFVDIDPKTFNIDAEKIREKITENTKAVLIVHLFGQPCEMKPIVDLCEEKSLILIEDAAQAHGAEYEGKKVGGFGDIACFSFYATKNMTTGEGGMITTDDENIAKRAKIMVNIGQERKYYHTVLGSNLRMTEMQAALGIGQLKRLDKQNEIRIKNAEFLTKELSGINSITTPFVAPKVKHVFHQYVIRAKRRDELQNHLLSKSIQTTVHYPLPIYKQPVYKEMGYNISLQNAEDASKEVLSLPVHPSLSKEDLEKIVEEVKNFS